jgi:hypothetical protein
MLLTGAVAITSFARPDETEDHAKGSGIWGMPVTMHDALHRTAPTQHSGAATPEEGNGDPAAQSSGCRCSEIRKSGMPAWREMLQIF